MNNRHPKKDHAHRTNRVVVITGAGAGRATVRQFAACGARIGLIGRDQSRLEQAADEARRLGGEALVYPADVADAAQVEAAAASVETAFGRIDVWANKLIPGLIDRYLARTGYTGQQGEQPADPASPDNLWQPVAGDFAAHGRFDKRAQPGTLQLWASLYRSPIALGLLAAGVLACRCLRRSKL